MRIGLTYTGTEWKHENYVRWLSGGDGSIEIVRMAVGVTNDEGLGELDGLVLSGGIDIHPALYGGSMGYPKAPEPDWEKRRDHFEQVVLEQAWARGVPVLGVCRGLQLINVTLKGTLVQDLGEAGDAVHERDGMDKSHQVTIEPDSLLAAVTGRQAGTVNSAHHQAIDGLGGGLRVNCRAVDGTIEGIEWAEPDGKPFMLAVQWHPERMFMGGMSDVELYRAIRERFIQEIGKVRSPFIK